MVSKETLFDGIVNGKTPDGSCFVDYAIKDGFFGYRDCYQLTAQKLIQERMRDVPPLKQ